MLAERVYDATFSQYNWRPALRMKTSVCICTYRRDHLLEVLLCTLSDIALDANLADMEVELLVIDNADSSATSQLCKRASSDLKIPLRYVAEPARGISQARNRAVAEALQAGADMIAFIDDDDIPHANWLQELVATQLQTGADIVFGCWVLGSEVPDWARDSTLFKSLVTGDSQKTGNYGLPRMASTCNVLIGRELLQKFSRKGSVFREEFSHSGGEDKDFFIRALKSGAKLESAENSIITRHHEPRRFMVSGLLQRGFKNGCSRMDKVRQHGTRLGVVRRFFLSFCKMLWVLVTLIFCLFSRRLFMHQLYRLGKSAGVIYSAFTGRSYGYYSG